MDYRHGYAKRGARHPLYNRWLNLKERCLNPKNKQFKDYGGRGITICEEWLHSPKEFIGWSISNGWVPGLWLDREDVDGNYSPKNCRFVSKHLSDCNTRLLLSSNTSGYRGVYSHKFAKKWCAQMKVNGKRRYLGLFDSPGLAGLRYDVEAFLLNDGRPRNFILTL